MAIYNLRKQTQSLKFIRSIHVSISLVISCEIPELSTINCVHSSVTLASYDPFQHETLSSLELSVIVTQLRVENCVTDRVRTVKILQ